MGVLNKKLSSWADTCRRIAGCSKTEPATQQPQPPASHLGEAAAAPRRTPKFPSRERNFAVRRRRRPDNNNGRSVSAIGSSCQLCSNRNGLLEATEPIGA